MSEGFRMVPMDDEQMHEIDLCIEALMHMNKNERAARLMRLRIAYQFSGERVGQSRPSNVVPMVKREKGPLTRKPNGQFERKPW
jgi:hypothetical protein